MPDDLPTLPELRVKIDALDATIQQLINDRARLAKQVADVKLAENPDIEPVFYRPEREAQVLRKVMERNKGPIPNEDMARIFREIMSLCLSLEQPMEIAYLGPEGTFTQAAAIKHFGYAGQTKPYASIEEVFREVGAGQVHYGVVPFENSTEGIVSHTFDQFIESDLKICGEVELRIHHHFLINQETQNADISVIYSHQQSLAQCKQFLSAHYAGIRQVAVNSNAEAAKRAAQEKGAAAIASDSAGAIYQLRVVHNNIEDMPDNTTRFLIIGREAVPASGYDRTSVLISTKDKPGALYKVLEPFHLANVNLTRIETRPSRADKWAYIFYIDFEGHVEDEKIKALLSHLNNEVTDLKVLGAYPKAVL